MKLKSAIFVFAALSLLASCAAPSTMPPRLNHQDVIAERNQQEVLIAQKKLQLEGDRNNERLDMQGRLNRLGYRVAQAAITICSSLKLHEKNRNGCIYGFEITGKNDKKGGGLNAYADGEKIYISPSLMRLARSDDELAFILAHEYSHNIMRHTDAVKKNALAGVLLGALADGLAYSRGYDTGGTFAKAGGQAATLTYSQDYEREADYVGMYILAHSGFNYHKASEIWRRMTISNPDALYISVTHPTNPERYVLLEKTASEIENKKRLKQPLIPNIKHKD